MAGSKASQVLRASTVLGLVLLQALASSPLDAQGRQSTLHVTDARIDAALTRLAANSATAARALKTILGSGLPVTVGQPLELASLPTDEGGPDPLERDALLAQLADAPSPSDPAVAWTVLSLAPRRSDGTLGAVERAWVAIDVDAVEAWIHESGVDAPGARVQEDLMVILAHELVAHVGSVAATRRIEDFCDDPGPDWRRGPEEPSAPLACSLIVENRVRRELNQSLGLEGPARFAERTSYALDVMNFERARRSEALRRP